MTAEEIAAGKEPAMQTESEQWVRDAAADIAQLHMLYPTPIIDEIRDGKRDHLGIVQTIQSAFKDQARKLREENALLRESLRNSMPIAGGNPFGRPSQALKETPDDQ